jgi:hypothetical protein
MIDVHRRCEKKNSLADFIRKAVRTIGLID